MWPVCVCCLLPFPPPQPADVESVRRAVEKYYSNETPWSEVAGPFTKVDLHLFTEDFGTAEVTLTWIGLNGTRVVKHRVALAKDSGEWRVSRALPDD